MLMLAYTYKYIQEPHVGTNVCRYTVVIAVFHCNCGTTPGITEAWMYGEEIVPP